MLGNEGVARRGKEKTAYERKVKWEMLEQKGKRQEKVNQ